MTINILEIWDIHAQVQAKEFSKHPCLKLTDNLRILEILNNGKNWNSVTITNTWSLINVYIRTAHI